MFNFRALVNFININRDHFIQKVEVDDFQGKQKSNSIFSDYLNSITSDVPLDIFSSKIEEIEQQAQEKGNECNGLNFKSQDDAQAFEEMNRESINLEFSSKYSINDENRENFNNLFNKLYEEAKVFSTWNDAELYINRGIVAGGFKTTDENGFFSYINMQVKPKIIQTLEEIPKGSHNNIRDARGCDISQLDLSEEQLLNLCIDKTTIMTAQQKSILEPYMESCKNPGLGIRQLHEQGFTGKGVNMAIIDQPLGMHQEYADNIIGKVHDINVEKEFPDWAFASMHGAAVTSIAVGENVGVAPDAGVVYYSAINLSNNSEEIKVYREQIQKEIETNRDNLNYVEDLQELLNDIDCFGTCSSNKPYVDAINQILDDNEILPENERVSVISISWGFDKFAPGYEELQQALQRAKGQGVFVVSTALESHYGMSTTGANRNPKGDLEDPANYEAGGFWKSVSEGEGSVMGNKDELLLVPMDHRTVADYTGGTSYRYEGNDGGMSWSTPWLAGMYVLAKQADPNITPEIFWQYTLETSNECRNNDTDTYVGRIINPEALIQRINKEKDQ